MKLHHVSIISVLTTIMFSFPSLATAQELMFGGMGNGSAVNAGALIQISQTNGAGMLIGNPSSPGGLTGIDFNISGQLFGTTIEGNGSVSTLITIDPNTGSLINTIGTITDVAGAAYSIGDLAFQPGTDVLFGIGSNANSDGGLLFTINTSTAVATFVGDTSNGRACGLGFAPDGTLYCWDSFLLTLNPANGSVLTTVVTGESFISAMGVRGDGTIFGARCGNCINPEDILTVNPLNGDVTFIGSTGAGHVSDIAFSPNTYEPVPTLSEWARFISIFALGFIGLLAMRRRWSIKP